MRIAWRGTRPGDLPRALIAAAAIASGLLLAPITGELARWLPECRFHRLTGWACPSCGATRATLALARGELVAAVSWNPLIAVTFATVALAGLAAPLVVVLVRRVPVMSGGLSAKGWWLLVAMILANWAYLVATGV